jgi:hypothetical protein
VALNGEEQPQTELQSRNEAPASTQAEGKLHPQRISLRFPRDLHNMDLTSEIQANNMSKLLPNSYTSNNLLRNSYTSSNLPVRQYSPWKLSIDSRASM